MPVPAHLGPYRVGAAEPGEMPSGAVVGVLAGLPEPGERVHHAQRGGGRAAPLVGRLPVHAEQRQSLLEVHMLPCGGNLDAAGGDDLVHVGQDHHIIRAGVCESVGDGVALGGDPLPPHHARVQVRDNVDNPVSPRGEPVLVLFEVEGLSRAPVGEGRLDSDMPINQWGVLILPKAALEDVVLITEQETVEHARH